jgi:hypothetical protein
LEALLTRYVSPVSGNLGRTSALTIAARKATNDKERSRLEVTRNGNVFLFKYYFMRLSLAAALRAVRTF